jgi:hypothetical protein
MAIFQHIFDVFSKRPEVAVKPRHEVPESTRNRVLLWCRDLYSNSRRDMGSIGRGDYNREFWEEIHRRLLLRTGRLQLFTSEATGDPHDAIRYVLTCSGEQFLDFLEDIFTAQSFFQVNFGDEEVIDELNELLRQDGLPYHVTYFVKETVREDTGRYGPRDVTYTRTYPKVIMKESDVLHENAIVPALSLLQRPHFQAANSEYLAALEDYRKGDIGDCLTKCGSAFESVLKVICSRKGWSYKQNDTAKTLINIILRQTALDPYFEQLLIIVATLRNRLSSAHGAGASVKQPARHLAQYALNATASAIILIAHETGEY